MDSHQLELLVLGAMGTALLPLTAFIAKMLLRTAERTIEELASTIKTLVGTVNSHETQLARLLDRIVRVEGDVGVLQRKRR